MSVLVRLKGTGLPQTTSFNQLPGHQPRYTQKQFTYSANQRERERNVSMDTKHTANHQIAAFLYSECAWNEKQCASDGLNDTFED